MTRTNDETFGSVLRRARLAADLTQEELAAALGVSMWTVSRLENGHLNPNVAWLEKMPMKVRQPVIRYLEGMLKAEQEKLRRLATPLPAVARRIARPTAAAPRPA